MIAGWLYILLVLGSVSPSMPLPLESDSLVEGASDSTLECRSSSIHVPRWVWRGVGQDCPWDPRLRQM